MLTATLEHLLNRGLPRSPRARELVGQLAGKRCALEVSGLGQFVLASDGMALRLIRGTGDGAQARIAGGPFSLLALAASGDQAAIQRGDVVLSGDTDIAQQYRELLDRLRPDLEEELAGHIGDGAAHQLGRFARAALDFGRRAADTTVRNAAEYFAHESRDLVSRPEGRQLLDGVDSLREDVDRLEARLELIERRLAADPR